MRYCYPAWSCWKPWWMTTEGRLQRISNALLQASLVSAFLSLTKFSTQLDGTLISHCFNTSSIVRYRSLSLELKSSISLPALETMRSRIKAIIMTAKMVENAELCSKGSEINRSPYGVLVFTPLLRRCG